MKLYQNNEGGKFADVTEKSRIAAGGFISGAICGDFDNDEKTDVAFLGIETSRSGRTTETAVSAI
ncbi:MAG: VCBS repeat-containing protein [Acidobacteria bacterium]|nr:VCBS repeat-containing protein [Acidobacteriota bacterium]